MTRSISYNTYELPQKGQLTPAEDINAGHCLILPLGHHARTIFAILKEWFREYAVNVPLKHEYQ